MTRAASVKPDVLRPLAREAIEREASALYRRASQVDVYVDEDRVSIHVELDRMPTVVHLGMSASAAAADLPAFGQEVSRVMRLVFDAMER